MAIDHIWCVYLCWIPKCVPFAALQVILLYLLMSSWHWMRLMTRSLQKNNCQLFSLKHQGPSLFLNTVWLNRANGCVYLKLVIVYNVYKRFLNPWQLYLYRPRICSSEPSDGAQMAHHLLTLWTLCVSDWWQANRPLFRQSTQRQQWLQQ